MSSPRRFLFRPVALLLVFAVMQVYVLVNPVKASAATDDSSTKTAPSSLVFGQLLLNGDQSVFVNGTSATSGTTILSGSQLQTPEGVAATVQLGKLGRLAIDSNTQLSLTFDRDFVDVQVIAGNAELTTNAGVKGTLITPAGEKLATNSSTKSTVGKKAAARSWDDDNVLGFILTAGLVTVAIIAYVMDDDNDSPSSP